MTERTAEDKAKDEKAFNFSSYNKLHWMLGGESYALRMAQDMFAADLTRARAAEKEFCNRYNKEPQMTNQVFNTICDLVSKCTNFYEVEALARYVFDDNFIPEFLQVKERAGSLRKIMPVWDILAANRNVRRSF